MPGSSGQQSSTVNIPQNIQDLSDQNIENIKSVMDRPYQAYTGPRIAGFTPDQNRGFDTVRDGQGVWKQDANAAGGLFNQAGSYNPQNVTGQNVTAQGFNGSQMGNYMNPYVQSVLNPQLKDISEQYGAAQSNLGATNALGGAFGSDQSSVMAAQLKGREIDSRNAAIGGAYANAFNQGAGLQQSDANRYLKAGMANQSTGLQAGMANQTAGLQGNQQRLSAAQGLQGLAQQKQNMAMNDANSLMNIGGQQQALGQQSLNLAQSDFFNQQNDAINKINLGSAVMSGQPHSVTQTGGGGKGGDMGGILGGMGGLMKGGAALAALPCWVAREVYGEDNPKWLQFREYLFTKAPAELRESYLANGQALAAYIKDKPEMKADIKADMDAMLEAA